MKTCIRCGVTKPPSEFYDYPYKTGAKSKCKECVRAWHREYNRSHRARAVRRSRAILSNQEVRDELLRLYGGRCACCGEDNPWFLTLDHVNNDGSTWRRQNNRMGGVALYRRVIRSGTVDPSFQLLCFNCNCGKQRNGGVCPHIRIGNQDDIASVSQNWVNPPLPPVL